jgi:hypothetical protein
VAEPRATRAADLSRAARDARVAGPYRLDRVVHERGLLATYRGEHVVTKLVALVRTSAPSVALTDRLRRALLAEAKLLARAEGPRVARLLEVDPLGGYFAVEDPRGPSLRQALTRVSHDVPTLAALALVDAMVEAVAVVHARGVVHAGLEPSAFSLTARDAVALSGFERAREKDADPGDRDEERAEGEPSYTAPEVLVGEPPTPASDVFSLGVIAYELCAGAHPFAGSKGARGAGPGAESTLVGHRIRNEKAPPIAESRAVPIDVERIIQRALSKQPAHRPPSAVELAAELRAAGQDASREEALRGFMQRLGVGASSGSTAVVDAPDDDGDLAIVATARPVALRLALVFGAMVAVAVAVFALERGVAERSGGDAASSRGSVRLLAHPWAEVWLDGALLDTTPIGRPVQVSAGKHELVFKHPRATDVRRIVDVPTGPPITVEVVLDVAHGPEK